MKFAQPYISYSQLSMYEHCPQCYFLRYHQRIKPAGTSDALVFGSAVHNTIDSYHKFGMIPNNIDRRVRAAIEVYADRYPADYLDATEASYDIEVRHPDTGEPLALPVRLIMDGYRLRGVKHIAEHKTAAAPWTQAKCDTEMQATLYSYAFRQILNTKEDHIRYNIIVKPRAGANFKLQVLSTKRDNTDYTNFWYWAKAIMDKMERGYYPKLPVRGFKCDFCKICV
jgi:hypothetical protein